MFYLGVQRGVKRHPSRGLIIIGTPLLLASDAAALFGIIDRASALSGLFALPIALWEFSLGVWLVVKGFKPSPVTAGLATTRST